MQGNDRAHYDQWVDREYFQMMAPSVDWEKWFLKMNFSQIGLDEDSMDVPMDEAGQPLDSSRQGYS